MKDGVRYNKKHGAWRVCVVSENMLYLGHCKTKELALDLYRALHEDKGE